MQNDEIINNCLEIARTRCLRVWDLLSREQVLRCHQGWRSGTGREDETALFYSLVAIGSRYVGDCDPTPAQANALFICGRRLLLETVESEMSPERLTAVYVTVCFFKVTFGLTL